MNDSKTNTHFLDGGRGWVVHNYGAIWIWSRTRKEAKEELKKFCNPTRVKEGLEKGNITIEKAHIVKGW